MACLNNETLKRFMYCKCCIFLFLVSRVLWGQISENDDLGHYFNVNTVTGHFELDFIDLEIRGPVSFAVRRSYSSFRALEANKDKNDLKLEDARGSAWMFSSGWSLMPYLNLLLPKTAPTLLTKRGMMQFKLQKPKKFHDADSKHYEYYVPQSKIFKTSGKVSSKNKIQNDFLKVGKFGRTRAVHYLADGSQRVYQYFCMDTPIWRLTKEITPSKHIIEYQYFKNTKDLERIQIKNPSGEKVFTEIKFGEFSDENKKHLSLETSENQSCTYLFGQKYKSRYLLDEVSPSSKIIESYSYRPGRSGFGARISGEFRSGKERFRVHFYLPKSNEKPKKFFKKVDPDPQTDKVRALEVYDPTKGEFVEFATFSYEKKHTRVIDCENNQIIYFHKDDKLQRVEYRNAHNELHSAVDLTWENDNLTKKIKRNGSNEAIFEKSFAYDESGNVVIEQWKDCTEHQKTVFKKLKYNKSQLVEEVIEENGLTYRFNYLFETNLVTSRMTLLRGEIIQRDYYYYNEDNLLVGTYSDDGIHQDASNLDGVTQRKIEKYDLDESTGMCLRSSVYFFDTEKGEDLFVRSDSFTYNDQLQVVQVDTQFEENGPVFLTSYRYDEFGNISEKISPLGRKSSYLFNEENLLITKKEPGQSDCNMMYDRNGRLIRETVGDEETEYFYDLKGRLIQKKDPFGNIIVQKFDSFGNCKETQLPEAINHTGESCFSKASMTHDSEGNIISHSDSYENTTFTTYNALRKPLCVTYPDVTQTRYEYNSIGVETKVFHSDGSETHTQYDKLERMTSKKIFNLHGELLCSEFWEYNLYHLLSYTDRKGLTTYYTYNCKGQKIREEANERITEYEYDSFGNVSVVSNGKWKKVQIFNVEGDLEQSWEESAVGKIENHICFFYDEEGRKEKAISYTSQGPAEDNFTYDNMGRLISHVDPEGNTTQFFYRKVQNSLGQTVSEKTVITPLGNQEIETLDANKRLCSKEKRDSQERTISLEEYGYDDCGNLIKYVSTAFNNHSPERTFTIERAYDNMGRICQETIDGKQITKFRYDKRGRLNQKKMPSGISVYFTYDELGRLLETKSTDNSVHYVYRYKQGEFPTKATDCLRDFTWNREYNQFDEMTMERRPDGSKMLWEFDQQGQLVKILLPDKSAITYTYDGKHMTRVSLLDLYQNTICEHCYRQFDESGHVIKEQHIFPFIETDSERDIFGRISKIHNPYFQINLKYGSTGLVTQVDNSLFEPVNYTYDALNQIKSEGSKAYQFDSLGNPTDAEVDHLNQIQCLNKTRYEYDSNGNTQKQWNGSAFKTYSYDALNRLNFIHTNTITTRFIYDPFSRLYIKEKSTVEENGDSTDITKEKVHYLYDRGREIGTQDFLGNIKELKILGMGIKGEIGAAIALELNGEVFLPLHDSFGNIVALVDSSKSLRESCQIDAFGHSSLSKSKINPWAFQSKRVEDQLVFFGLRFYDPNTMRFLTPDPSGFDEHPNMYLFVLNSPANRLDLFGLYNENYETRAPVIDFNVKNISSLDVKVYFGETETDWIVYSNRLHELQFTPEELSNGYFDILNHFGELLPVAGKGVGLIYGKNGIQNNREQFEEFAKTLYSTIPKEVLTVVEYTPTLSLGRDIENTLKDKQRGETKETIICEQSLRAIMETVGKVNEDLQFGAVCHSRGGSIFCSAMDRLTDEEKQITKRKMHWIGIAPAEPILDEYCLDSLNIYSKNDWVTGGTGRFFDLKQLLLPKDQKPYKIKFVNHQNLNGIEEHFFSGKTYNYFMLDYFGELERNHVFIQCNR